MKIQRERERGRQKLFSVLPLSHMIIIAGPAFNAMGQCMGMAFQTMSTEKAENVGYIIPTVVKSTAQHSSTQQHSTVNTKMTDRVKHSQGPTQS